MKVPGFSIIELNLIIWPLWVNYCDPHQELESRAETLDALIRREKRCWRCKRKNPFSFLTPERVHQTQLPSRQVSPLSLSCTASGPVATIWGFQQQQACQLSSSVQNGHHCQQVCCQLPLVLYLSSAATLPNVLPPPHDCLLNFRRQLTIKNDYGEIKSKQSFIGRNIFSHLPTCNIK